MNSDDVLFGRVVRGVLTLSGDAPSIKVENAMLVVRDGPHVIPADWPSDKPIPPVAERIETLRLPRAGCPVKHIVVTRPDGFITFAAAEWLREVGVSLAHLDWHGGIIFTIGLPGPDRPAMRRAQALAAGSPLGLAIMREILRHKLAGEAAVARLLGGEDTAGLVERLGAEMGAETAQSMGDPGRRGLHILSLEAAAASAYWALWSDVCMRFARRDRVPDHWQVFGSRRRPKIAAGPAGSVTTASRNQNAASAPVAILNYLYGLAASQVTIALVAVGLDPGIGIFHADRENRASLAYDAIEVIRPYIEAWLLCVLADCRFAKRDFYEEGDGTIRLTRPLSSWLAMSTPLWRQAAEAVARWLTEAFERSTRQSGDLGIDDDLIEAAEAGETLPVPAARGGAGRHEMPRALRPLPAPLPSLPAPGRAYKPALAHEVMPRACHECGRALDRGATSAEPREREQWRWRAARKFCSRECSAAYRAAMRQVASAPASIPPTSPALAVEIAAIRASRARQSERLVRREAERKAWDAVVDGRRRPEAKEPLRQWYIAEVVPKLKGRTAEIAGLLDVSRSYAYDLSIGRHIPHWRHFGPLAELVGLAPPEADAASRRQTARALKAAGEVRFSWRCPKHGLTDHYTASGQCVICAAEGKDPERQKEYWAQVREKYNAGRRAVRDETPNRRPRGRPRKAPAGDAEAAPQPGSGGSVGKR